MPAFAESYDEIFEVPGGRVGVLADIFIIGDMIEVRDTSFYAVGVEHLAIGTAQVRVICRTIETLCVEWGFKRLRMTGDRLTGAGKGRHVDLERILR